ncbi:MAG: TerC family protein [Hyphomicrobiales bacterium]|nr:TerC family protein [Hyphomicrobiales bacterium]MDE2114344.1 TerC family protein [Hyphomicrobiales bacterium]
MPAFNAIFFLKLAEIVWVDVLLSGDNALVIAMACRGLPERQRRAGLLLGGAAAIGLRLIFALLLVQVLELPYLKLVGGLALLWIAIKLATDESEHGDVHPVVSLWTVVRLIAVADAAMSFDNVLSIVAIADENIWLIVLGLLASIPLIVSGSALLLRLIDRFPVLIWAGSALLGYVAVGILLGDTVVLHLLAPWSSVAHGWLDTGLSVAGSVFCVLAAWIIVRRRIS